jgi:hypothetical protein
MLRESRMLSEEAKKELQVILSIADKINDEIINLYSHYISSNSDKLGSLNEMENVIVSKTDLKPTAARAVVRFVSFISKLHSDEGGISDFIKHLGLAGFDHIQQEKIRSIIDKLENRGIINSFSKIFERIKIENFGLPHLFSLELMADYRLLRSENGQKKIIPVILGRLNLHAPETKKELNEIVFQFTPDRLDELISNIKDFKDEMESNLIFIEKKLSSEG